MKLRFSRKRAGPGEVTLPPEPVGSGPSGDVIEVRLVGAGPWLGRVDAGLGGGVRIDGPVAPDVVVVVGAGPEALVAARDDYPDALTLAVVPFERSMGAAEAAVALFEAGADACLIAPGSGELTAQLVALVRRRGLRVRTDQVATPGHHVAA